MSAGHAIDAPPPAPCSVRRLSGSAPRARRRPVRQRPPRHARASRGSTSAVLDQARTQRSVAVARGQLRRRQRRRSAAARARRAAPCWRGPEPCAVARRRRRRRLCQPFAGGRLVVRRWREHGPLGWPCPSGPLTRDALEPLEHARREHRAHDQRRRREVVLRDVTGAARTWRAAGAGRRCGPARGRLGLALGPTRLPPPARRPARCAGRTRPAPPRPAPRRPARGQVVRERLAAARARPHRRPPRPNAAAAVTVVMVYSLICRSGARSCSWRMICSIWSAVASGWSVSLTTT